MASRTAANTARAARLSTIGRPVLSGRAASFGSPPRPAVSAAGGRDPGCAGICCPDRVFCWSCAMSFPSGP
ncbi:hypothetical protein ACFQXA_38330 [Nocardiopsis composta]